MTFGLVLAVGAGALCAGFVTGLAGFGTGLVALGFWLHVIDARLAAPLVVICSVIAQVQSLFVLRRAVDLSRLWPFVLGGLLGVPLGVAALQRIDAEGLRTALGIFLVLYAGSMLLSQVNRFQARFGEVEPHRPWSWVRTSIRAVAPFRSV